MAKGDIKRRREIERLSASLPSLTSAQKWEAQQGLGTAWIGARKGWCDVCAREFDSDLWERKRTKRTTCPHCGAKLAVKRSPNKRKESTKYYFHAVTVAGDWQVVRTFLCTREARRVDMFGAEILNPSEVRFDIAEVFQRFLKPEERQMIIGLGLRGMSYYSDQWKWDSGWKIRKYQNAYSVWGWMSKDQELLDGLKLRGLKKLTDEASPYDQIEAVFFNYQSEVMLKAGAVKFFEKFCGRDGYKIRYHWDSIRVALRHGYHRKVRDVGMYLDYLDLLRENGKDVRNPHYICPGFDRPNAFGRAEKARKAALKKAHDEQMAIRERRLEKERQERARQEAIRLAERLSEDGKTNVSYMKRVKCFLDVVVKSRNIEIRPLRNVREFFEEGSELCHCVFTNKYYQHHDCLILGARVDGKRTETIEIDTKNWRIAQCRGKHNQNSRYHDRIMEVMNNNIDKYRRAAQ